MQACGGNNGPVDLVTRDELKGRAICQREGAIGATDFVGILIGEQIRIGSGDGETRGAAFESLGHAVVEPLGGAVEARVGSVMIAQQRGLVVGEERGDERGAGAISLLCDAARQGQRVDGRGHHELLSGLEAEADIHRDGCELIQALGLRAGFRGGCGGWHCLFVLRNSIVRGRPEIL